MCGAVVCTNGPTHTASYRQLHQLCMVYKCTHVSLVPKVYMVMLKLYGVDKK